MYWVGTMRTLSTAYDGLVDVARRGGSEGTQIVPDLATSLPVITDGETTYAFQLRRGIRYSNGTLVKASDFLRAFERPFRGRSGAAQDFPLLVGADACKRRPRRCDLSQGVRTDDATGTIVFHLRRPDPDFLGSLTGWAPIPPGTPNRDLGTRPVPSTGPYMIKSYVPKRTLTLVRNPYFRVWSRVATPDGFPDRIVVRLSSNARAHLVQRTGLRAVERGQADLAFLHRTRDPGSSRHATHREFTGIQNRRRSSSSSTRGFRLSTTYTSAARSTLPSTALPLQGLRGGRGSLRRPASCARRGRSVSGATAPTRRIRIGQACGRRPTCRGRVALSLPQAPRA